MPRPNRRRRPSPSTSSSDSGAEQVVGVEAAAIPITSPTGSLAQASPINSPLHEVASQRDESPAGGNRYAASTKGLGSCNKSWQQRKICCVPRKRRRAISASCSPSTKNKSRITVRSARDLLSNVMQDDLHSDSTRQNGVIAGNTNSMTQYSYCCENELMT
jgi:hypothetical protein